MKWKKLTPESKLNKMTYLFLYIEYSNCLYWGFISKKRPSELIKKGNKYKIKYGKWEYNASLSKVEDEYSIERAEFTKNLEVSVSELKSWEPCYYLLIPEQPYIKHQSFDILNHGINCPVDCECQKNKQGYALGHEFDINGKVTQYIEQNKETNS